jgi:hypothetical protein
LASRGSRQRAVGFTTVFGGPPDPNVDRGNRRSIPPQRDFEQQSLRRSTRSSGCVGKSRIRRATFPASGFFVGGPAVFGRAGRRLAQPAARNQRIVASSRSRRRAALSSSLLPLRSTICRERGDISPHGISGREWLRGPGAGFPASDSPGFA